MRVIGRRAIGARSMDIFYIHGEMKMIFFHKTDKLSIDASDFCVCYQHVQKLECLGKRVR